MQIPGTGARLPIYAQHQGGRKGHQEQPQPQHHHQELVNNTGTAGCKGILAISSGRGCPGFGVRRVMLGETGGKVSPR